MGETDQRPPSRRCLTLDSISDCNARGDQPGNDHFGTKTGRYVARQIVRYNLPMSIPTDLQAGPRGNSGTARVALSARRKRFLAFFAFVALSTALVAQQPTGGGTANSPPDNPQPQQQTAPSAIAGVASDIGYVTHKSWFFPNIAASPEALTPPGKFKLFLNESISPANILTSAIGAAYSQARNNPEAYGQGWDAYGGRFGASLARSASTTSLAILFSPPYSARTRDSFRRAIRHSGAA